jgi:hypothetical protein
MKPECHFHGIGILEQPDSQFELVDAMQEVTPPVVSPVGLGVSFHKVCVNPLRVLSPGIRRK